jgi:hypothetical protein
MDETKHYTVGQLHKMHEEKFGIVSKSRNRPALLKKLGRVDAAAQKPVAKDKPVAPSALVAIRQMAKKGLTLRQMAAALEEKGVLTRRGGKQWWPSSVQHVLRKLAQETSNV